MKMGVRKGVAIDETQGEKGFTLLEALIASALLGLGLLGMAAMQGVALVKNVDANELTRVTTIASDMLERIQFNRRNASTYNGIDTDTSTSCNTISNAQAKGDCLMWNSLVSSTQLQNIRGTVTVSNIIPPTTLGQRTVMLTVSWMGSMKSGSSVKRGRSITFDRVIATE